MRRILILSLGALAALALALDSRSFSAPSTIIIRLECNSCSLPATIPAGTTATVVNYDDLDQAKADFEDPVAMHQALQSYFSLMLVNVQCQRCPGADAGTCPRTVHSDMGPDSGYLDLLDNGDGTASITLNAEKDIQVWICCGEC